MKEITMETVRKPYSVMADEYLDWTALLEDDDSLSSSTSNESSSAGRAAVVSRADEETSNKDLRDLLHRDDVSVQVKELVKEHIALKQNLDALTGHETEKKDKDWNEQRFGFPKHTVQSRIKDRKRLRYEERVRMLEKRDLEAGKINERYELKAQQIKEERLKHLALQRALTKQRNHQRHTQAAILKNERLALIKLKEQEELQRIELRHQQRLNALIQQRNQQKAVFENIQTRTELLALKRSEQASQKARELASEQQAKNALKKAKQKKQEEQAQEAIALERKAQLIKAKRSKHSQFDPSSKDALSKKQALQDAKIQARKREQAEYARQEKLRANAPQKRRAQLAEFDK